MHYGFKFFNSIGIQKIFTKRYAYWRTTFAFCVCMSIIQESVYVAISTYSIYLTEQEAEM